MTTPDLKRQGDAQLRAGDLKGAREAFRAMLDAAQDVGDARSEAAARQGLGRAHLAAGDGAAALTDLRAAFRIHLLVQDAAGAAAALGYMGQAATLEGSHARAAMLLEWALALHRGMEDELSQALDLDAQGRSLWELEEAAAALGAWWEARRRYRDAAHEGAGRLDALFQAYEKEIGPERAESMRADLEAHADERRRAGVERAHAAAEDDDLLEEVRNGLTSTFGGGGEEEQAAP